MTGPSYETKTEQQRRAEERIKAKDSATGQSDQGADTQRPLHELPIHQGELEVQNKELKQQVEELTAQLSTAVKELESFGYSVSHDLQAPLRTIDGYIRMILKRSGDQFDEDTRNRFEVIRSNAQKMGQLIEDLLVHSRLGRKQLSIVTVDMETVFQEAWQELSVTRPERSMTLKSSGLPSGMADRALIRQVVSNILSNAAKFSKPGAKIIVEAGGYQRGNEIVYTIKDNGVGFDVKYHDKLFGMFQRLHNPEKYEGRGAGLAIVQRIIHRHGGRIWAEGEVDKGATFYFTLPKQRKE